MKTTWTPKIFRMIAFYRFRAIILPTCGGLGKADGKYTGDGARGRRHGFSDDKIFLNPTPEAD